jgi:hypothetical protein
MSKVTRTQVRALLLGTVLALAGCDGDDRAAADATGATAPVEAVGAAARDQAAFDSAYTAAKAEYDESVAARNAWTSAQAALAAAKTAAEAGDFAKGMALAREAGLQSDLALAQKERETAWLGSIGGAPIPGASR